MMTFTSRSQSQHVLEECKHISDVNIVIVGLLARDKINIVLRPVPNLVI